MNRHILSVCALALAVLLSVFSASCRRSSSAGQDPPSVQTAGIAEPTPGETEAEPVRPVRTCVMLGDSLTARGDFSPYFASVTVVNLGISGDTIAGVTERLEQAAEPEPDLLMILCGINSLSDDTFEQCLEEYRLLASEAATLQGDTRIVLQSVLPADELFQNRRACSDETIRAFNDGIRTIAEEYGFDYLDLYPAFAAGHVIDPDLTTDGLHLNEKGYDVWAELIRPYIEPDPPAMAP